MCHPPRNYSERVKTIFDFASTLDTLLLDSCATGIGNASNKENYLNPNSLDKHTEYALSLPLASLELEDRAKLGSVGTKLWNTCTRLLRNNGGEKLLSHARGLAFFLLECAAGTIKEDGTDVRLLKVALKTADTCIGLGQLDLALKVLEKAALREKNLSSAVDEDQALSQRLSTEYYILRISLAWHKCQFHLAEHMFSRISLSFVQKNVAISEKLAGLLYNISRDLIDRKEVACADKWLTRAYEFSQLPLGQCGQGVRELRFCILHGLVRVKLMQQEAVDGKILELLDALKQDYGNELAVTLLTLDVINKMTSPDAQQYFECLCTIIETAQMTESNFKLILGHIHQLRTYDAMRATQALEHLLLRRLVSEKQCALLEKGVATYIWIETSRPGLADGFERLTSILTKLNGDWKIVLTPEAAHASLILIWKKVCNAFEQEEYEIAERWCQLAQYPIFENVSETNRAKIQRKNILCALESHDVQMARQTFAQMSESCKSDPLTSYLMYRVALQADDLTLARDCLEALCKHDSEGPSYLLACVAEAQHSGMRRQVALVLQQLVDKLDGKPFHGIYLPALLRCTARLLIGELTADQSTTFPVVDRLCNVFESSVKFAASREHSDTGQMPLGELEWFSQNSYNLALQHCTSWEPQHLVRLLNSCVKILGLYPTDIGPEALYDVTLRRLLCHFLAALVIIAQARMQEDPDMQRNHYLDSRLHIQMFRKSVHDQLARGDEKAQAELQDKYRTLLAFDFEASVRLCQWNSLNDIVEESRPIGDEKLYSVFADAILCSGAPKHEISSIFQMILRVVREKTTHDASKISRWLRCLFQRALESHFQVAEAVLEHAYLLARDTPRTRACSGYPQEELEWLAITAFNRGIDFYLASDDVASRRWCAKALDIAQLLDDHGSLYTVLQDKFACLKWDD